MVIVTFPQHYFENDVICDVKIDKLNTDDNQQTAAGFAVTSIPTVILFKDGEIVDKVVGAPPKAHFDNMLSAVTG